MDTTEIIALITIAAAILQIILFFKVWGMTNDVRKIRNCYVQPSSEAQEFEIRKAIILGEKEKAKQIIISGFLEKVSGYMSTNESEFNKLKEDLQNDLSKINETIPENIKNMNNIKDFYNIFKQSK